MLLNTDFIICQRERRTESYEASVEFNELFDKYETPYNLKVKLANNKFLLSILNLGTRCVVDHGYFLVNKWLYLISLYCRK